MRDYEVLHSPFDVETHKATFIDYLEVIILPDGTIEYAVPSHQARMEQLISPDIECDCPPFDYMDWLIGKSGAIPVWNDFHLGEPNDAQGESLDMLAREGLYRGRKAR